jgi:outer membrane protein
MPLTFVMRRLPPLPALALGATLSCAAGAQAQSLKDLYEAARAYDAAFQSAQAQARSAAYRVAATEGIARPQAALTGSGTTANVKPPIGGAGDANTVQVAAQVSYALINRANDAAIAQARRGAEIDQANLDSAEQDLVLRVAQAYFDVLAAQDTLATVRANKAAITEQLASAKRNFEVGTATITDTREAQARYDAALAEEIVAENNLHTARIALDQLVGRAGTQPQPLQRPVLLPPVQPDNVETWVSAADDRHPAIRRARIAVDLAQLETERARAADAFTLNAVGSVGAQRASGTLTSSLPGTTRTASVGLQFNLPLYTGGSVQNAIQEKLLLAEKARQDLDNARRTVAQGTRVAYFGVQSGQAQARALQAAEASSQLALEATQLGYRVGVRVNVDVLNAQTQLYQTQRDLSKARYDVLINTLRLRQASGQLGPADLEAVNALLAR